MKGHQFAQTSKGQDILSTWQEGVTQTARSAELMREVGVRESELMPRFAEHYRKLRALPRRARRAMQRKWKHSLAGVALFMALGAGPAAVATINVDGATCTLVNAITTANDDTNTGGCVLSDALGGADTIILPANSTQGLMVENNNTRYGPTGLPVINSEITIQGNGSTIRRMSIVNDFRIFAVSSSGNLTLQETTVSGGQVFETVGGGVRNEGTLTVINSAISGNSTSGSYAIGGGVFNGGTLTVTNSTISGNSTSGIGSQGGGVYNILGTLTLTDSTVSGNSASGNFSYGGGIYNDDILNLTCTLISGNISAFTYGMEVYSLLPVVMPNASNLFGHSGLTTAQALVNVNPGGSDITATSNGTTPTALASILNTTLQNNGGPTRTHALIGGSPAVDAAGAACSATDQRGVTRPQPTGGNCDIGAFELEPAPSPSPSPSPTPPPAVTCGGLTPTIVGTPGNDTITGTNGNDVIHGLGGNDVICGGDGGDTINGGNGKDTLIGDGGSDILDGGDSNDTVRGGNGNDQMQGGQEHRLVRRGT